MQTSSIEDYQEVNYLADSDRNAEHKLEIDDLYEALNRIPEMYKTALILFEISGFSIREISGIENCTEDAVKQRLSRGRKLVLTELSERKLNTVAL